MEKSTISYVLSIIGLILVLAACSQNQPAPPDTPSEPVAESVVMNEHNTLSTLAIESSPELTFLTPLTSRIGVYNLMRADIQISIEFFAVENGRVLTTPLGPSLSTHDGSIRVNNDRPRYANYSAVWHTNLSNRSNGDVVRAEVRLSHAATGRPVCNDGIDKAKGCLGFFDVQLWNSSWDVFYRRWFQYDNILDIRNRWSLPIKFHIAQGTDIPNGTPNTAPTLSISAPSNNTSFSSNDSITLTASANDAEDGNISHTIQWSSNDFSGTIPKGGSTQLGKLAAGTYTFTAQVSDSQGASAQATVTFTVRAAANNTAPTLSISNPQNNTSFTPNDSITLKAQANDAEDGDISHTIQWSSSNFSGDLPKGGNIPLGKLPVGSYTLTATVSDSQGVSAQATVTFTVSANNTAPSLTILSPSNNSTFSTQDSITLKAQASDTEDGNLSTAIQWSSSNFSGTIPQGGEVSLGKLPAGSYTFTAKVRDSQGALAQQSIAITIREAVNNNPPNLRVITPTNYAVYTTKANVMLIARASDIEDGNLTNKVQWTCDKIANIPQGGTVDLGKLAIGTYVFTATIQDSHGATVSKSFTVNIYEPVNYAPIVTISSPTENATFTSNDTIRLSATANDTEDGDVTASIQWSLYQSSANFTPVIPQGNDISLGKLPPGRYAFRATAKDSQGKSTWKQINFTVTKAEAPNTPPTLNITSPGNNAAFTSQDNITLVASANDAEDGDISGNIQWSSNDFTGAIAKGGTVNLGRLGAGSYTFTAKVTDSQGAVAEQSVRFGVTGGNQVNTPPTLTITSPKQGDSLTVNDAITLVATADDAQDGDISANIQWTAEQGYTGTLPAGPRVPLGKLPAGSYIFVAKVTDSEGATAISRISFSIIAGSGSIPNIQVISPNQSTPIIAGREVILEASATDAEDGNISSRIQWSSTDYQGNISQGGRVVINNLQAGKTYTFKATVSDSQGNKATVVVTFTVQPAS